MSVLDKILKGVEDKGLNIAYLSAGAMLNLINQ